MATILLSAAGAMIGGGFGGTIIGLSGAVIGRAVGATVGRLIDQRLIGGGAQAVETGRIDRFRLTAASEGTPIPRVWGRMRLPGQVIWASPFQESTNSQGGGKGPPRPKIIEYSYSVSVAIALCEGEIQSVGRVWADGDEVNPEELNMRIYTGDEAQEPDPLICAIEGQDQVPAYRGIAYVVLENLELSQFGNRVPQFTFEVTRKAAPAQSAISDLVNAVCLIPGTGEYALATTPVQYDKGMGVLEPANQHAVDGSTDFSSSIRQLRDELPQCQSTSLVVSWFGDDLRCGACQIKPKVESNELDGNTMPWQVSGIHRSQAQAIERQSGRPIYGGTPADAAVVEAIVALNEAGQAVMFYPFVLMDQLEGNEKPDPYGATEQSVMPWRGRITASVAPGRDGSPERSDAVRQEVDEFFGAASVDDFLVDDKSVSYSGDGDFGYRRMVLHYAHLCALAGGVDAFCIGSEMRGLTTLRGADNSFPAVEHLRQLAADCRQILGPNCKLSYAADWSEYFGYHSPDGDIYFHLDPLWADENIDFVGIDNYLPLSDWRDGEEHLDAAAGATSIYDLDYLRQNVCGGEYFDWYYADPAHRDAQVRTQIEDLAHEEHWIYRPKDLRGWWSNEHRNRVGGSRAEPTAWRPGMKPIRFTELGCAALDKATNQPNKFLDLLSSEAALPWYSDGRRDDLLQMQYLRAVLGYWSDPENNPASELYEGRMLDVKRAHIWAWDSRPFPQFPALTETWSDGVSYARGHWLNGRSTNQPLSDVVAEICDMAGLEADVSALHGVVRGYKSDGGETGRMALQPLMLAYGFDAVERDGKLLFRMRNGRVAAQLDASTFALEEDQSSFSATRAPKADVVGRVQFSFIEAEGDYQTRAVEAIGQDAHLLGIAQTEMALVLTSAEGKHLSRRWLAESRLTQEAVRLRLPPSQSWIGASDVVSLPSPEGERLYRVDRTEISQSTEVEAVRIEPGLYTSTFDSEPPPVLRQFTPAVPVLPVFLDLPMLTEDASPHAPWMAATAKPWPGTVAAFSSVEKEGGYSLNTTLGRRATIGRTLNSLAAARPGLFDRGEDLVVQLTSGQLASSTVSKLLAGANVIAIGDGSPENWEIIQFERAELIEKDRWAIRRRLRGQAGSDANMPKEWPAGSMVVLIDEALSQIKLARDALNLERHYRIGPAKRPWDDSSYVQRSLAFSGVGLRPYAPCHLRATKMVDGGLRTTWIRRTRIGGDSWSVEDVPLNEGRERYLVSLQRDGAVLRESIVQTPEFALEAPLLAELRAGGPFEFCVAQLSDAVGPGPFRRITIDG